MPTRVRLAGSAAILALVLLVLVLLAPRGAKAQDPGRSLGTATTAVAHPRV